MRKIIGWLVAVAYAAAGARWRVVRRLRGETVLPVVVHALPAADLEKILAWLKKRDLIDRLWLTFDDGWTTLKSCVPVLEKYDVPAKVFVAPGETLRGNVWTEEASRLGVAAEVWRSWYSLSERERNEKLDEYSTRSTCSTRLNKSLLSKNEIVELSKHPLITIQNHTWSHLSAVHRPVEEVVDEVKRAQETIIEWTGHAPQWIAWPFGRGNAELDARMKELGLTPIYTRQGYEIGPCRNMAIEGVTFQENLGRVLGAWPKVGVTV